MLKKAPTKQSKERTFSQRGLPKRAFKTASSLPPKDTSWGNVATWYDAHLEKGKDTYHEKVVYPHLLRIIGEAKDKRVLDLACGQGQFSRMLSEKGSLVTGIDLGEELITIAKKQNALLPAKKNPITYVHGSADTLSMFSDVSFDIVVCVLALQNIENLSKTIKEAHRVLKDKGTFIFVLNHPAFRNPRQTHWGYDESTDTQYRRVDEYMSESHTRIDMTPGSSKEKKFTVSFHRPLQVYIKALAKAGFVLARLEEWESHKVSEQGPRQKAENKSRKEIPLFMCIEAKKGN